MAVKTWYVLNTAAAAPGYFGQLQDGGTAPTAANCTFGWAPGKLTANYYCSARLGASGTVTNGTNVSFIGSVTGPQKGTGATNLTAGDSFITPTAYTGSFVAGTWTLTFNMIATTAGLNGRLGLRVWASVNADGSSARELTSGEIFQPTSPSSTAITTTATAFTFSWSAPAITLTSEYVFFQLEYQEGSSAGSNNNDNAFFRVGSSIATTNYTPAPIAITPNTLAGGGGIPAPALGQIGHLNAPVAAVAGTAAPVLLMHLDTGYYDATRRHVAITPNAYAGISTTTTHFGSGSFYDTNANNNGNVAVTDNLGDFTFTGDFTIDLWWYYPSGGTGWSGCGLFDNGDTAGDSNTLWIYQAYYWNGSANVQTLGANVGGIAIIDTVALVGATWYHVALTRQGSNLYLFKNGALVASGTYSGTLTPSHGVFVGSSNTGYPNQGNLDELRVVNGTAVWTSNFTPPTAPYAPAVADVTDSALQVWYRFEDTTGTDSSGHGNTAVSVAGSPFMTVGVGERGSALVWNGGTGNVIPPSSAVSVPTATSSWTLMCWVQTTRADGRSVFGGRNSTNTNQVLDLYINAAAANAATIQIRGNDGAALTTISSNNYNVGNVNDGKWHHIAAVFDASAGAGNQLLYFYVDGISQVWSASGASGFGTAAALTAGITLDNTGLSIGGGEYYNSASYQTWVGGIDDFRFYNRALSPLEVNTVATNLNPYIRFGDVSAVDYGLYGATFTLNRVGGGTPGPDAPTAATAFNGAPAFTWDGTGGYQCQIPNNYFIFQNSTMCCWVNYTSLAMGPAIPISLDSSGGNGWSIALTDSSFGLAGNYVNITTPYGTGWVLGPQVTTTGWHHLALTVDGSKNVIIYIDGVGTSLGVVSPYAQQCNMFTVGEAQGYWPTFFNGTMADARAYTRCLTATDVATLYSNGPALGTPVATGTAAAPGDVPVFGGVGGLGASLVKYVPPIIAVPGTIAGLGALSAAVVSQTLANANLAGAGALNAVPAFLQLMTQPNLLPGAGALNAVPTQQRLAASPATLAGAGAWNPSGAPSASLLMRPSTVLPGTGSLAADAQKLGGFTQWQGSAGFVGAGAWNQPLASLLAQVQVSLLSGFGNLTASVPPTKPFAANGTIFSQSLIGTSYNWQGQTLRQRFEASILPTVPPGGLLVKFQFAAGSNGSMDAAYVGHAAATGDPYDFDGNQMRLLFGGAGSYAVIGAQTVSSDNLAGFAYDATRPLIVSAQFSGSQINLMGYGG